MKHKRYLVIAAIIATGFLLCGAKDAKAYDHSYGYCMRQTQLYTSGVEQDLEAIKTLVPDLASACTTCAERDGRRDYPQGTMWLNGNPANSLDYNNLNASIEDMYYSGDLIRVNANTNEAVVYVHGQVYSCGNDDQLANPNQMNAKWIYILTGKSDQQYTDSNGTHNCGAKNDFSGGAPISRLSSCSREYVTNRSEIASGSDAFVLNRMYGYSGNQQMPQATWSDPAQAIPIKIDVAKFKAAATYLGGGSYTQGDIIYDYEDYSDMVWVFRCPTIVTSGTGDERCGPGNAEAEIKIRVITKETVIQKNCSDKYPGSSTYDPPSWYGGSITYSKCSGQSVLGSRLVVDNNQIIVKRSNGDSSTANIAFVRPGANVNFDHFFFSAAQPVTKTIIDEGFTGVWTGLDPSQWQNSHNITSAVSGNGYATQNNSWSNGTTGITGQPDTFNLTASYKFENGHSGAPTANGNNSWKVGTGDVIYQANYGDRTNLGSASIGELKVEDVTNVTGNINSVGFSVAAPYNFTNTAAANATIGNGTVIFAGETANMRSSFTTNPVSNGVVIGGETPYATKSPNSSMRLYTYYADSNETASGGNIVSSVSCATLGKTNCEEFNEGDNQTLNSSENVNGSTRNGSAVSVKVLDINAGKWLCGIAAVYPATSGSAANTSISGFSGWYVSGPSCIQIAKKPTFQIWNGNLYTNGSIQTNASNKSTVSGHAEITSENPRAFSSWVEQGIISRGNNNNLASGAVMGYQYNISTVLSNEPGGHKEGNAATVCKRAPLTVANQNCVTNNNNSGNGNSGVAIVDTVNLDDFKSTAAQAQSLPVNTNVVLSSSDKYKEVNGIRYFYNASTGSKIYLSTDNLAAGANYVVYSKGSVYINGNITYTNGGYTSPSNVPQLIIITDGSIFIDGNVTRVDAWLIAKSNDSSKGVIKTCADSNGATPQSEASCSKQLRINGPIVARQLELNRVYGAATGNNSATPAEIINLSPATYVFSQSRASDNASLRTVYSKEIAPRW